MVKLLTVLLCAILPTALPGVPQEHEASAVFELGDVRPFVARVNEQLGLELNAKILSDYSYSIAVGNKFAESVDVHYRGIILTIRYSITKSDFGNVRLSFISFNQGLISDIRAQMMQTPTIVTNAFEQGAELGSPISVAMLAGGKLPDSWQAQVSLNVWRKCT